MARIDPDISCPHCLEQVTPGDELEIRCLCGDLAFDHADGVCGTACSCATFEWDGTLGCPACFECLDDTATSARVTRTEAA